jgi:hypothetical protein
LQLSERSRKWELIEEKSCNGFDMLKSPLGTGSLQAAAG